MIGATVTLLVLIQGSISCSNVLPDAAQICAPEVVKIALDYCSAMPLEKRMFVHFSQDALIRYHFKFQSKATQIAPYLNILLGCLHFWNCFCMCLNRGLTEYNRVDLSTLLTCPLTQISRKLFCAVCRVCSIPFSALLGTQKSNLNPASGNLIRAISRASGGRH